MTGMVVILAFIEKIAKEVKIKSQEMKNILFGKLLLKRSNCAFLGPVTSI